MGNEQSTATTTVDATSRRSLDSNFVRQVTPLTTPRSVCLPRLQHNNSDSQIPISPNLKHRASTDCTDTRIRPKLSLCGVEMGNQQGRRLSRATVQIEASGDGGCSLAETLKLTSYQTQLLQSTWAKFKNNNNTFTQVFKLLCFKSTVAREIFQKISIVESFRTNASCDLNAHAKVLSELLDSLMADLNQSSKIVQARCMDIGAAHVNMNERCCGVLFDQLGESLNEVITKVECVRSKREAVKAWMTLLSYLVDGMKCGYMDEWKRKQSGRLTFTQPRCLPSPCP